METVIFLLKAYLVILTFIILVYMMRHYIFTHDRLFGKQKLYYQDILDNDFPSVTVIIPMHNEEAVAETMMSLLMQSNYPVDKLEIIPVNDHSTDETKEILERYAKKYPHIRPYHREDKDQNRGKVHVLNEVMAFAKGEIIVVFDADYQPPKDLIKELVIGFKDPEVGATMGRVLVANCDSNLLTIMLELERSGGYQVDQQARYNMDLMPQYGGTVGAYRKKVILDMNGFDTQVLAEDTDLTYKMYLDGWKVAYANRAECYEEATETWEARARQVRRWARGHNEVMFRHIGQIFTSKYLSFKEKLDAVLLLFIYMIPLLIFIGILSSATLFFLGELEIFPGLAFLFFIFALSAFGNFAPFFQVGAAAFIDGRTSAIRILPLFAFNYVVYMMYISLGFFDAVIDFFRKEEPHWDKTERHKKENGHE